MPRWRSSRPDPSPAPPASSVFLCRKTAGRRVSPSPSPPSLARLNTRGGSLLPHPSPVPMPSTFDPWQIQPPRLYRTLGERVERYPDALRSEVRASAVPCPLDLALVTCDSPERYKRAVEATAFYFRRETGFSFAGYEASTCGRHPRQRDEGIPVPERQLRTPPRCRRRVLPLARSAVTRSALGASMALGSPVRPWRRRTPEPARPSMAVLRGRVRAVLRGAPAVPANAGVHQPPEPHADADG